MNDLLQVKDIVKNFSSGNETLNILTGVNLTLREGESVSITGESGSGKSTLLHIIGGLDSTNKGTVTIEGTDITDLDETELSHFRNKKIGFIFQSHYLLEEFNAIENVMIPFLMNQYRKKEAYKRAENLLALVGLQERMKHHPSQMSGGERQRVAIARAFMNEPPLILADEPTGNLDNMNADKALELLFDLTNRMNHALILVTHSPSIAAMSQRRYRLQEGLLVQDKLRQNKNEIVG